MTNVQMGANEFSEVTFSPKEDGSMAWTVAEDPNFQKSLSKASLLDAEEKKYLEWRAAIPASGGTGAAQSLGYSCRRLSGDQWEFYVGQYHRISFNQDDKTQTVTLLQVGHT